MADGFDQASGAALVTVLRLFLGVFFLASALGKARDHAAFRQGVQDYQVMPPWAVAVVSRTLPWGEALLAGALLLGVVLPLASMGLVVLLLLFSGALTLNLRRGRTIACHCHGLAGMQPISWGLVARNGVLTLFALTLALLAPWTLSGEATRAHWATAAQLTPADGVLMLFLLGWCSVIIVLIERSVALWTRPAARSRHTGTAGVKP